MSFDKTLPMSYKNLKSQLRSAKYDYDECMEIADPDSYEYHDCDCEYCPVPEMPEYTQKQREEAQAKADKLQPTIAGYEDTIAAVERYAKWRGIKLPEIKL